MRELVPGHEEHLFNIYGRVVQTGESIRFENHAAYFNRWFDVYAWRYGEPRNRQVAVLFSDITERKQAEKQREQLIEELARSNRELEEFAYITSHDLKTPLRQVTGFLDLLQHRYAGHIDEKADHYIAQAVRGAEQMYNLIEDILIFSRVGFTEESLEEVDVDQLLSKSLINLRAEIEASGAEITSSGLPRVRGDENQLAQLFGNLIGNAIKYRKEQEPPRIRVTATQLQDAWEFRVEDNGIGFDQEYEGKIFQIFQRLHSDAEFSGTGIGLAICKKIVEQHGGRIRAQSNPGQGATFYFTIPFNRSKRPQ